MKRILCCLMLFVLRVGAQSDRGTITGTIVDSTGSVAVSAAVEAQNTETGASYNTTTTTTGNYTLAQLPAGSYSLSVTVPGFKKYVRQGLTVEVAQTLRIDVTLEIGSAAESVTVTEAAALLKTESGELSHNVAVERLNDLPVLQTGTYAAGSYGVRNANSVTVMIPGTYYAGNSIIKVNGAPANTNSLRIEGQDSSDSYSMATNSHINPGVDAVQEYAIQTSNYAAEFGQAGGGVYNLTMKSGTNQFHGSAYDYFVNEALNAGQPFTNNGKGNLIRPSSRANDYGFTVGGPVWIPKIYNGHDKTFFFFNLEQYLTYQTINSTAVTVPTAQYRNGDFSQALTGRTLGTDPIGRPILENTIYDPATQRLAPNGQIIRDPFPGNMIPGTRIDPVARAVQDLIPTPQTSALINNLIPVYRGKRLTTIRSAKVDELLSARDKLSFYISENKTASVGPLTLPAGGLNPDGLPQPISTSNGLEEQGYTERLNYDRTITPTMLLHVGVGMTFINLYQYPPTIDYNATTALGLKGPVTPGLFPEFDNLLAGQGGVKNLGPTSYFKDRVTHPTAVASLTYVKDNHTFKIGADARWEGTPNDSSVATAGLFNFTGAQTGLPSTNGQNLSGGSVGFPYASFLLGLVDNGVIAVPSQPRLGKSQYALFIQDTWKVTRKFTLDYGLRWDYGTYQKEQYGRMPSFSSTLANPSAGGQPGAVIYEATCKCAFAKNYPYAIGPRLGAAYQITSKTVLRTGVGLMYATTPNNNVATRQITGQVPFSSPSFGAPAMVLGSGVPLSFAQINWPTAFFNNGYYPLPNTLSGPPKVVDANAGRPGRQMMWSIGLQREVTSNLLVEAAYVGNRGAWWEADSLVNYNALTPQILATRGLSLNNPGDVQLLSSTLNSSLAASRGFNVAPYAGFPATSTVAQSLRPFPQFNSGLAPIWAPLGDTWYNALQAKVTKRTSHGLEFTYTFTWSKQEANGGDIASSAAATPVNDVFNRQNSKYLSSFDQPLVSILALTYTLPKWGGNKVLSYAVRDWQINPFAQYSSGLPIQSPLANNQLSSTLFQTTFANRVPGVNPFAVDINCHCYDPLKTFVLNPAAWTNPATGQFGTAAAYYDDYRYQRRPVENIGLGRLFRIKERMTMNIRIEFTNVFNRAEPANPVATNAQATQTRAANGQVVSGFGALNTVNSITSTTFSPPRQGTMVARFTF
jgi:hypothetical protein